MMDNQEPYYVRKLMQVTLYYNDLRYLEGKLLDTGCSELVQIYYNEDLVIRDIQTLREWSKEFGVNELDYLHIDFGFYMISFTPRKTIITFILENSFTYSLIDSIVPFLILKQSKFIFPKQRIYLYSRPREKSFWFQDKTPLWLTVLLALLPIILSVIALVR